MQEPSIWTHLCSTKFIISTNYFAAFKMYDKPLYLKSDFEWNEVYTAD